MHFAFRRFIAHLARGDPNTNPSLKTHTQLVLVGRWTWEHT